jgi:uncharacterized protein YgfB (UPF0149 family)
MADVTENFKKWCDEFLAGFGQRQRRKSVWPQYCSFEDDEPRPGVS